MAADETKNVQGQQGSGAGGADELVGLLEARSSTYALLARLYRKEIDEELLDELHEMLYPMNTGNDDVDRGYLLIATYLSNLWTDSLTELSIDYTRCFIGVGAEAFSAAYPYESVYTSEKRLLMQEARDEVLSLYRACGIAKAEDWTDAEDHIALELEFEKVLCERTVKALRSGDEDAAFSLLEAQQSFLEEHLCAWVPMMMADLKRFAHTKLYSGLAYLTEGYLDTDSVFLKNLLVEDDDALD